MNYMEEIYQKISHKVKKKEKGEGEKRKKKRT